MSTTPAGKESELTTTSLHHDKKNKIKDLYSPFRCEEMPETADRIDDRTAVSDIISHRNGNYRSFILFIFYHSLSFT